MRIAIVMPLAEQRGGAEAALRQLMREGRDQGVEWHVVFLEEGPMIDEFRDLGVSTSVVRAGRLRHVHRYVGSVFQIRSIAKRERIDLIVSWMSKAHLYVGVVALIWRLPSAWYQHGIPARGWIDRLATILPARGVIATSQAAADAQACLRPVRSRRVVYPGTDLARFDPGALPPRKAARQALGLPVEGPLIGFFGRLQRWKGVSVLVDAMPPVLESFPSAHCVIVGGKHDLEPNYPSELQRQIGALGLARHVTLAGFQSDVPTWMQATDVIVLPSENEPFGITVIEAMAMGKPVVAGDSGGPREIVTSGVDGVLVPHDNANAVARAILEYLRQPSFAAEVGAAARERAKRFTADRYARELIHALRELSAS